MTLLELMVVLGIITTSIGLAVSSIKKQENQIKKTLRQLIALNRQLHSYARLKRNVYRLAFTLDETNSTWWVEKKTPESETTEEIQNANPPPDFVIDPDFVKEPQKLPQGLSFSSVEFRTGENKLVSEGQAYIHYFPSGQFDQALLKLKSEDHSWSLFIDRFLGEARIFSGEKTLEDLKQ